MKNTLLGRSIILGLLLNFFMFISISLAQTINDPYAYYKMEDKELNTTVIDSGTGQNNGAATSFTNALSTDGKINRGMDFKNEARVNVTNLGNQIKDDPIGSVAFWIKPAAETSPVFVLGASNADTHYVFRIIVGKMEVVSQHNTARVVQGRGSSILPLGEWTHVVYAQDGDELKIYINGNEEVLTFAANDDKGAWIGDANASGQLNRFFVGGTDSSGTGNEFFAGALDDFRYYKRTLSPEEVTELYNFRLCPYAHYKMEDKELNTTTVIDSGTGQNNGAATSFTDALSTDGKINRGMDFKNEARVNVINLGNQIKDDPIGSVAFWIKPAAETSPVFVLGASNADTHYVFRIIVGKMEVVSQHNTARVVQGRGSSILPLGEWTHVVYAQDGDELKIYINGNEEVLTFAANDDKGAWIGDANASGQLNRFFVGGTDSSGTGNEFFAGALDDFRYYKKVLNEADISALYNNGLGTQECNFTNHPPILDPIGNKTGLEGDLLEFQITATDEDANDILTFSASNLPEEAIFDPITATFSWLPSFFQAGNYANVEFSVQDNGIPIEVDVELITITIGNANRPPVFDPIDAKSVLEDELIEFMVNAIDPDGDNVEYSVGQLPAGAEFNVFTKNFSWSPDFTQAGVYPITFFAADDGAPSLIGQIHVLITVGDVPTAEEAADQLINDVLNLELAQNVENSYLANLKKIKIFIQNAQLTPAKNQLLAFINKVSQDMDQGLINSEDGEGLINKAFALINLIYVE